MAARGLRRRAAALVLLLLAGTLATSLGASDLVAVQPVHERILRLHFDDGHLDYFDGATGARADGVRHHDGGLDTAVASAVASYALTSSDDANYASPIAPIASGRKSKGQDFYTSYASSGPTVILEHWLYLEFPHALVPGRSYVLTLTPGLVANGSVRSFVFDPAALRSPTVHVSQLGFPPEAPKHVYLSHWMGSFSTSTHEAGGLELDAYQGAAFTVVEDVGGAVVFSGNLVKRKDKLDPDATRWTSQSTSPWGPSRNYTMADVYSGDFSALTTPGCYRVVVERLGCSFPFEIHADVYRRAFRQAMRGLFLQRQGIIQEVRPGLEYPRDHLAGQNGAVMAYDPAYRFWENGNHDLAGNGFDFSSRPVPGGIWGWYHDAGDWDTYLAEHLRVPAQLLLLYHARPEAFSDGEIGNRYRLTETGPWIEEGGNGLPDLLDEARWYVDFAKRARQTLIDLGHGSGGVPGYVGVDAGAVDGVSWQDARPMGVTAEDPVATYTYAGVAGLLARCLDLAWGGQHPGQPHPDSAGYRADAEAAWQWAEDFCQGYVPPT